MWSIILNIVLSIILAVGILCQRSVKKMFDKIGENFADILQNRDKEYESEKGRNLATKEDIEEITQKIEQVKAEVSFKNQWQHDHIRKREERLLHILHLANKIMMAQNRIVIKSRNAANINNLFELIDEIDSYAVELADAGNMLLIDYHQFKDIHPATHLVDTAAKYAGELSCLANNVANSLQGSEFFKNRALEKETATSQQEMRNSMAMSLQAQNLVSAPLQFKQPTQDSVNDYIKWLEGLYGKGLLVNYKITDITTDSNITE